MHALVTILIAAVLIGPADWGLACTGVDCTCAERSCCTLASGCCETTHGAVDDCDCGSGGCSDCIGCALDDDSHFVDTSRRDRLSALAALPPISSESGDVVPRSRSGRAPATFAATGPPRHVLHCVWLT